MTKAAVLKAGALIEPDENEDKQKLPSRRQLIKLEQKFDSLPSYEIIRRLYKRHQTGLWQLAAIITWAAIIYVTVR